MMRWFSFDHLPQELQGVSSIFGRAAEEVDRVLPESAEKTVALRKLLEGKDAAVRAKIEELEPQREAFGTGAITQQPTGDSDAPNPHSDLPHGQGPAEPGGLDAGS